LRFLAVLLLAGCGRLEFGARSDGGGGGLPDGPRPDVTLANHDEDADGLDDALDTCPHVPGANTDTDGDGVGDACDPEPTNPRQRWESFSTMRAGDHPYTPSGTWVQLQDAVSFDGTGFASQLRAHAFTEGVLVAGITLVSLDGLATFHQIAFGGGDGGAISYFIEIQDGEVPNTAQITLEQSATFAQLVKRQLASGMHPGDIDFAIGYVTKPSPQIDMKIAWPGEPYTATVAAPLYAGNADYSLGVNNCALAVRYIGVIQSSP
jgi:hypothetical protein